MAFNRSSDVNTVITSRLAKVKPSPTMAVTARAAELRAAGEDVIGLGAGEPDFDTPQHIKEAAKRAIDQGQTKYTAVGGTPELKAAVARKFERENGLQFRPDQILISCGGKQSFYNLVQTLIGEGDEVVIPAPYWVSYPDIVLLADGTPVAIETGLDEAFKVTPEKLRAALTGRTKLLVLNSPSNPTGAVYTAQELAALGAVLRDYPHVWIASDDIYEKICWGGEPFVNIANVCPELADRVLVLNGVSKAYAMTGWRIGYAAGNRDVIREMTTVQSQCTSNPCSISQAAAVAALDGDQGCIVTMNTAFERRHDMIVAGLNAIEGVRCIPSGGAFYAFPDVSEALEKMGIDDDVGFAEALLNEVKVALVPGSAFGAPGYVRLSFATSDENLTSALQRIRAFVEGR